MILIVMKDISTLLKIHHLTITNSRKSLLQLFINKKVAISHNEIEKELLFSNKMDRVTIYRNLQSFLDKGLIHVIPTDDRAILYALCESDCDENQHYDDHVHFFCERCEATSCLSHVQVPLDTIQMPIGYSMKKVKILVSGMCNKCSKI